MVRKLVLTVLAILVLQGCQTAGNRKATPADGDSVALAAKKQIVSPSGTTHRIYPSNNTNSPCWVDPNDAIASVPEYSETPSAIASGNKDAFTGSARKAVKTSIADGPEIEDVQSIADLYAWIPGELKRDDVPAASRAEEENFNATVAANMVAAKFEGDHDYHVILADDDGNFWNIEVSGLPKSSHPDFLALQTARNQFHDMVSGARPTNRYDTYDPPIPVVVSGSLFFDSEHTVHEHCGPIGPGKCKPCTAWELHPVTSIRFADE